MDIKELQPIFDLMSQQKERICIKINEIHNEVVEVKDQVTQMNGRGRQNERDILELKGEAEVRKATCGAFVNDVKTLHPLLLRLNKIIAKPKTAILMFIGLIVTLQIVIFEGIEHKWFLIVVQFIGKIF